MISIGVEDQIVAQNSQDGSAGKEPAQASKDYGSNSMQMKDQITPEILMAEHLAGEAEAPINWGQLKPFCFNEETKVPKVVISLSFFEAFFLNLLFIIVLCLAIPLAASFNANENLLHNSEAANEKLMINNEILYPRVNFEMEMKGHQVRRVIVPIYCAVWTTYQIVFLLILLFLNPGQGYLNIFRSDNKQSKSVERCQICKSFKDKSTHHCQKCNICCLGYDNHSDWIGKCIGMKNKVFLGAYYIGFAVGTAGYILILLMMGL